MGKRKFDDDFDVVEGDNRYGTCTQCKQKISLGSADPKAQTTGSLKRHLETAHALVFQSGNSNVNQELMVPGSVAESEKWDRNSAKAVEVDFFVVQYLIEEALPLAHVEGVGFQTFMSGTYAKYKVRSRHFYSDLIDRLFTAMKEEGKKLLENVIALCLTTDAWQPKNGKFGVQMVTAHGVSWPERFEIALSAEVLERKKDKTMLGNTLMTQINEYDINVQKIVRISRDGEGAISAAIKDLNIDSIHCVCHRLHLLICDGIKADDDLMQVLTKMKKIVEHINQSGPARHSFRNIQTARYPGRLPLILKQSVVTRWNSSLDMLERFELLYDCVVDWCVENSRDLSEVPDIRTVRRAVETLANFRSVSQNLQLKNVIASDAWVGLKWLEDSFHRMDDDANHLAKSMQINFPSRFDEFQQDPLVLASVLLDPRCFGRALNASQKQTASDFIIETYNSKVLVEHPSALTSSTASLPENSNGSSTASMWSFLDTEEQSFEKSIEMELNALAMEPLIPSTSCPIIHWGNAAAFPLLKKVAQIIFVVVPTSVPSERFFTACSHIYSPTRNRLNGETLEKLAIMNYNKQHLPKYFSAARTATRELHFDTDNDDESTMNYFDENFKKLTVDEN